MELEITKMDKNGRIGTMFNHTATLTNTPLTILAWLRFKIGNKMLQMEFPKQDLSAFGSSPPMFPSRAR
jgi:hypothetical protein